MGKTAKSYLSESAKKVSKGVYVSLHEDKIKYSHGQFVQIYKGYDFLENIYPVRVYIQKRYNIDWLFLELLIKLMAMKIFTQADYSELPKEYSYHRWKGFVRSGYVNVLSDHHKVQNRLYTLNTKAKNIVINFYKYLSGEKKIPEDGTNNPMAHKQKQVAFDRKKLQMIHQMNQLPIKEHNKKLF